MLGRLDCLSEMAGDSHVMGGVVSELLLGDHLAPNPSDINTEVFDALPLANSVVGTHFVVDFCHLLRNLSVGARLNARHDDGEEASYECRGDVGVHGGRITRQAGLGQQR